MLQSCASTARRAGASCFNGHPPLGVNATIIFQCLSMAILAGLFQWAPTLGGECYYSVVGSIEYDQWRSFNGHPPLGVNATAGLVRAGAAGLYRVSMGTHPRG